MFINKKTQAICCQKLSFGQQKHFLMLPEICREILVRVGVQIGDELPLAQLIRELERTKPEAAALIIRFKNHSEACKMLQSDHEMRYKIPDIWRMQL
jgi:hypothetical protein